MLKYKVQSYCFVEDCNLVKVSISTINRYIAVHHIIREILCLGGIDVIREHRSREKLEGYYRKFVEEGILDPNVHPWVAESWMKSRELGIGTEKMDVSRKLPKEEFAALQAKNQDAIDYLSGISEDIREFFQEYNLSLLLIDSECRVLKSYSLPFYQMTPGEIEGVRVGVEDVGTSSISGRFS